MHHSWYQINTLPDLVFRKKTSESYYLHIHLTDAKTEA